MDGRLHKGSLGGGRQRLLVTLLLLLWLLWLLYLVNGDDRLRDVRVGLVVHQGAQIQVVLREGHLERLQILKLLCLRRYLIHFLLGLA